METQPAPVTSCHFQKLISGWDKEKLEGVTGRDTEQNVSKRAKSCSLCWLSLWEQSLLLKKYCNTVRYIRVRKGSGQ